jgi:hypothetical protein
MIVHLIMRDDLVLGFLQLHQFAKFVGLACLAFANDLGMRFEQTNEFIRQVGESSENARLGLSYHAANSIRHGLEMLAQSARQSPATPWQFLDLLQNSSCIAENLPRQVEKLPAFPFAFLFSSRPWWRNAWAIAITRLVTLRFRSRIFFFSPPVFCAIFFIVSRQYTRPVVQQAAVGRIVNVGLHYCGVHPHLASTDDVALLRHGHQSVMQLANRFRPTVCPSRTSVLASDTFSIPIRQKRR